MYSSSPAVQLVRFFFFNFIDSLWISYYASWSHSSSCPFLSALCPCKLSHKIKFKRKTKNKHNQTKAHNGLMQLRPASSLLCIPGCTETFDNPASNSKVLESKYWTNALGLLFRFYIIWCLYHQPTWISNEDKQWALPTALLV